MKRWLQHLATILVLVLPAIAVYAWQTRDLLPAGERLPAPAFALAGLDGAVLDSAALHGQPTVLYFFAPWCAVCAASAPQLRWFNAAFGDSTRLVLVALSYDSREEVVAYAESHALTGLPVLLGDATTAAAYRIRGFPTYYVLDAEGRVAARDFGLSTFVGLWWRTRGLNG